VKLCSSKNNIDVQDPLLAMLATDRGFDDWLGCISGGVFLSLGFISTSQSDRCSTPMIVE